MNYYAKEDRHEYIGTLNSITSYYDEGPSYPPDFIRDPDPVKNAILIEKERRRERNERNS